MSNVRDICVELLTNVEKNQAYSTVAFQNVLQKRKLDARDRGLLTELFYGTIQRKLFKTIYRETKEDGIMGAKSPTNDCIPNGVFRASA